MSRKQVHVRRAFDICFSKYHHLEDVLEVERDDAADEADIADELVNSDDELFFRG